MTTEIYNELKRECPLVREVQFSNNRETIGMIEIRFETFSFKSVFIFN